MDFGEWNLLDTRSKKVGEETVNKVVLIGGNHHNGLGLVRCFGMNGIAPYGIIVGEGAQNGFVSKSKYWAKIWAVSNEQEMLELLCSQFGNELQPPVVLPWSDGAAQAIDENLDKLKDRFILPSIQGRQGEIVHMMDKASQTKFFMQTELPYLKTKAISFEKTLQDHGIQYPVILKPVMSTDGDKMDITICRVPEEYERALDKLRQKGYDRILVQHYLEKREEYVLTGAVACGFYSYTVVCNERRWPPSMGCGSFSRFEISPEVLTFAEQVLCKISDFGYQGPIDIDFFSDEQMQFYMNEINWRSGGRNFVGLYNGVYSPYQYYCAVTGLPIQGERVGRKSGFTMNEVTDLRHVVYGNMSVVQWLKQMKKTKNYAVWFAHDLKPVLFRYAELLRKMVAKD